MKTASKKTRRIGYANARAPGKIILTGEHFVVLGAPAVAMAINLYAFARAQRTASRTLRVEADIPLPLLGMQKHDMSALAAERLLEPLRLAARESLDYIGKPSSGVFLDVDCEIPVGAGLGSSAATTVAIIEAAARAQGVELGKKEVFEIAFAPESYLHGSPSGVDQAASTYGGILRFSKQKGIQPLSLKRIPELVVCDTGIHRSTRGLVSSVVKRSRSETKSFREHVDEVARISDGAVKALKEEDDRELGTLLNRNQELLEQIGVSHPKLNELVKAARRAGASGAKLTGAGGGGCIIALCEDQKVRLKVAAALKGHGGTPYLVSMDPSGVLSADGGTALK